MIEEYLEQLRKILVDHHYEDVDNAISYMREFAEDRKELGESEESIIASFGDIHETASAILGEEVKNADVTSELKEINTELISADLSITESNVSDVEVNYTDEKRFTITDKDGVLTIKEKKQEHNFFLGFKKAQVDIQVPQGYLLEKMHLEIVSGDIPLQGIQSNQLNLETVSGDNQIKECKIDHIEVDCVSGDIKIKHSESKKIELEAVSGDVDVKETTFDELHGETVSGDAKVEVRDIRDNYTVKIDKMFHSKEYGTGIKLITLESTVGDLNVDFK